MRVAAGPGSKEVRMNRAIVTSLVLALIPLGVACEKTAADEQSKVNSAQEQANREIGKANMQADEAQRAANQKILSAQDEFLRMREEFRTKALSELVDVDGKIAKLDAKAQSATKAKSDLQANLAAIRAQREAVVDDVRSIDSTTTATFDGAKARVEKELSDLRTVVDKQ
jgi:hypothetical protein